MRMMRMLRPPQPAQGLHYPDCKSIFSNPQAVRVSQFWSVRPAAPPLPAPAPALKPSPFLNQHEEEVLGGVFGFTPEQRAALREAGAISTAAQVKG